MKQISGQMSLFQFIDSDCHDYRGKPDYHGETDEIFRYSIEHDFEMTIKLRKCSCGGKPSRYVRDIYEQFVMCTKCGKKTKYFRHAYEGMQAWNRMEVDDCQEDSCRGCDIPNCPKKQKEKAEQETIHPVDIMDICDDAYCPVCGDPIDEFKWMDCDRCPSCGARISWEPWHRANDEDNLNLFGENWREKFGKNVKKTKETEK